MNNPWWNISYKLYRLRSTQVKEELVLIKQDPICLDESQNNLNHIRWQLRYYVYRLLFISFSLKKAFPVVNKIVHSWLKVFGTISLKAFVSSKWEWLREKCPYLEFSGPYFPANSPNTGNYGPESSEYGNSLRSIDRRSFSIIWFPS